MFLIVGLGNIGKQYENTRHNIGFKAVEFIGEKYNISINRIKFKGTYGEGTIGDEKVILLKPSTFMNLSGESVREVANFYKIPAANIIILHDDMSIDVGRMRIRAKGSAGGQNGIKNIILQLGTEEFPRIKLGVGQPKPNMDWISHVMGGFSKEEKPRLEQIISASSDAVEIMIKSGVSEAMNKFNGFKAE